MCVFEIKFPGKDIFHSMCVLMGVCVQMCEGNVNMYDYMVTAVVRKAAGKTIAPFNEFKRPKINSD